MKRSSGRLALFGELLHISDRTINLIAATKPLFVFVVMVVDALRPVLQTMMRLAEAIGHVSPLPTQRATSLGLEECLCPARWSRTQRP